MPAVQVSARIDSETKLRAQEVFERQGIDIPTAIKILITKTANEQEVPISLSSPRAQKSQARSEVEREIGKLLEAKRAIEEIHKIDFSNEEDLEGWDEW